MAAPVKSASRQQHPDSGEGVADRQRSDHGEGHEKRDDCRPKNCHDRKNTLDAVRAVETQGLVT